MNAHTARPSLLHVTPTWDEFESVALAAARSFVRVQSRAEAAQVLHAAVSSLGGALVAARASHCDALPLDVSLGIGEPQLVATASGGGPSLDWLARVLPALVEDAMVAADNCDSLELQTLRAGVDELTGVASRRAIYSHLNAATASDIVGLLDLDEFKALNDTWGHAAGDDALKRFGETLRCRFRSEDFVGRYGGDEFLLILRATDMSVALERLRALGQEWSTEAGPLPTISAGLATVDTRGGTAALRAADRALHRAKRGGRNSVECATPAEFSADGALS